MKKTEKNPTQREKRRHQRKLEGGGQSFLDQGGNRLHLAQALKCADHEAGTDQQQHRKRHLNHYQRSPDALLPLALA